MRLSQHLIRNGEWQNIKTGIEDGSADIVFVYGASSHLQTTDTLHMIRQEYPNAALVGCSTAGEITGDDVYTNACVVTAIQLADSHVMRLRTTIDEKDAFVCGQELAAQVEQRDDLKGLMVLSPGHNINGSALVEGVRSIVKNIPITGGLAGDGADFGVTRLIFDDLILENELIAIAFYGENLQFTHGSVGGWDAFGPKRSVTRSDNNILYELDHQPALALYKKYLGDEAANLPSSGLLYPLMIKDESNGTDGLVRTLLSVDHEQQSMTFAGNLPEGAIVQLMHANFEKLVDGAELAAQQAKQGNQTGDALAMLISCVGRRLVLKQRAYDEVEAVQDKLGNGVTLSGFYSYGEISPHVTGTCELHNQTMTITLISERT